MSIRITEHIEKGGELYSQILPMVEKIPARSNPKTEISFLDLDILAAAIQELREWLDISLDIVGMMKPESYDYCIAVRKDILESVNGNRYIQLYDPLETYSSISSGLCDIIGILKSIKGRNAVIGPSGDSIFIVHGHDTDLLNDVKKFITFHSKRTPIVLSEEANGGKVLLEKFLSSATKCTHAIILMTADDICASKKNSTPEHRARQNVILEYGYFIGKLGRENVCVIFDNGVELPSDLDGIVYLDSKDWEVDLKRELDEWDSKMIV